MRWTLPILVVAVLALAHVLMRQDARPEIRDLPANSERELVVTILRPDGRPAEGCELRLRTPELVGKKPIALARGITDARGRCRFEPPRDIAYRIHAQLGDELTADAPGPPVSAPPGPGAVEIWFDMPRHSYLRIRCIDAKGAPAGCELCAYPDREGFRVPADAQADNATGEVNIRVEAPPGQTFVLHASPGYGREICATAVTTLLASDPATTIVIHEPAEATVRVVDREGNAIAGALVTTEPTLRSGTFVRALRGGSNVETDEQGIARVAVQKDQAYRLLVHAIGHDGSSQWGWRAPASGEPFEVRLKRTHAVFGRVFHADGEPAAGYQIEFDDDYKSITYTNDDGAFATLSMRPGWHILAVYGPNWMPVLQKRVKIDGHTNLGRFTLKDE